MQALSCDFCRVLIYRPTAYLILCTHSPLLVSPSLPHYFLPSLPHYLPPALSPSLPTTLSPSVPPSTNLLYQLFLAGRAITFQEVLISKHGRLVANLYIYKKISRVLSLCFHRRLLCWVLFVGLDPPHKNNASLI